MRNFRQVLWPLLGTFAALLILAGSYYFAQATPPDARPGCAIRPPNKAGRAEMWLRPSCGTAATIDSVRTVGPMTFAHMAANGMPEEHWSAGATTLIHAARLSLRAREGGVR